MQCIGKKFFFARMEASYVSSELKQEVTGAVIHLFEHFVLNIERVREVDGWNEYEFLTHDNIRCKMI